MASKNFSKKFKELRLKAGYSQKDVYEHFKIPQSTFSSWEVGKSEPFGEMLIKLCTFYQCDMVKEFSSDTDLSYKEWDMVEKYRFIAEHSPDGINTVETVLNREYFIANQVNTQKEESTSLKTNVSTTKARIINYYYHLASAGTGQIVFDVPPTEKIEIPNIPKYQKADYAIGVSGDSMEPEFQDGDMLLIEMTEEISPGEIGIFLVDGEYYVKELGKGELISLNPEYGNIALTENSRCRGRVLGNIKNIRNGG